MAWWRPTGIVCSCWHGQINCVTFVVVLLTLNKKPADLNIKLMTHHMHNHDSVYFTHDYVWKKHLTDFFGMMQYSLGSTVIFWLGLPSANSTLKPETLISLTRDCSVNLRFFLWQLYPYSEQWIIVKTNDIWFSVEVSSPRNEIRRSQETIKNENL